MRLLRGERITDLETSCQIDFHINPICINDKENTVPNWNLGEKKSKWNAPTYCRCPYL